MDTKGTMDTKAKTLKDLSFVSLVSFVLTGR